VGEGDELGRSGRANGGMGRCGARRRAGWRREGWEIKMPQSSGRGALASKDDGAGVVDSDGGSREGYVTTSIA
jgi:hypothetical protein